jgi:hypothetical protein
VIAASGQVSAQPEAVFAFLADLRNHWLLTDRWTRVVALNGAAPDGGTVRIHGPGGVWRTARTCVVASDPPRALQGEARVGRGTVGAVRWTLEPRDGATHVRLEAEVVRASAGDRALLALGGRWWLRRGFRAALRRLDEHVDRADRAARHH